MNGFLSKMLYALTSAYSRKDYDNVKGGAPVETNIGKLFSIFAWGLEIIQTQADLIKLWDDLDYAQGAVLDRYGANFGVARGGASDELYRIFIRIKMIAQLSGGDEDTIIKDAAELLGVEYTDIDSEDVWPAKKLLLVDESLLSEERLRLIERIAYAIKRTMAAGVGLRLYLRTYRTFVLPIDVKHGGAIVSAYAVLPVGRDRQYDAELSISHGSYLRRELSGFPVEPSGPDRKYREPVDVSRMAFLSRELSGFPINPSGPERVYSETLDIARGAYAAADFAALPNGKDRSGVFAVPAAVGGFARPDFAAPPHSEDRSGAFAIPTAAGGLVRPNVTGPPQAEPRAGSAPVGVAYGAFEAPGVQGVPPNTETAYRGRRSAESGALYHTHIKPKRIE